MNKDTVLKVKQYLIENGQFNDNNYESRVKMRENGKVFSFEEHLKALIYSLISARNVWERVENNLEKIDELFFYYDTEQIIKNDYEYFYKGILSLNCGSQLTKAQMRVLHENIDTLRKIEKKYGSMDAFVTSAHVKIIMKMLSDDNSPYKIKQLGPALAFEYLKNVGIDCAKPDVHMKRILGCNRLGYSKYEDATDDEVYEAFHVLSNETGMPMSDIDLLFWIYCAEGKGEICTANPKCYKCVISDECNECNQCSINHIQHNDIEYSENNEKIIKNCGKQLDNQRYWVLTVKDKINKTFMNIIFLTSDVSVAHEYIEDMKKIGKLSFVSLQDTERISNYVYNDIVSKQFSINLRELEKRKVPGNYKEMFIEILEILSTLSPNISLICVPVTV